ncbi:START domain-containing protein [Mucilaginibacter glaciei]|uniref:Lipid-binding protein n=1 Tax=Mucilaginibacter glaciei TaxID=2772109 RepID=A0A926S268_9SPHI|nr:START domain-containing protein [Mucilaginibacter glaciei]MBD1394810.1 lipid-binding protein [Mucilaginibacter glaciei]
MFKCPAILLLLLLVFSIAGAQTTWTLKNDHDGIKVYSSPVENSKVKALRVECNFQANLSQIVAVLLDVKTCTEWVYHTKSCTLLKQVSPSEVYYYSEVSLPWPVENRDFVAHLTVTQDPATKVVIVDGPAVPGMVSPKTGIVRIANSKGKWLITPVEKNEVKVEYTLNVDPAGNLPAWAVNLLSSEGPLQSFKALRSQLKKPEYRNANLSFIKN